MIEEDESPVEALDASDEDDGYDGDLGDGARGNKTPIYTKVSN